MDIATKHKKQYRRHKRIRAKITGRIDRPRLVVFRSNQHIYAQLIDDEKNTTLLSASDLEIKTRSKKQKIELSKEVGKLIAKKAQEKRIRSIVFDRRGYKYHGHIKALAEGAREGGLKF